MTSADHLPEAFRQRMSALLGGEYRDFIASCDEAPARSFRVNTIKISAERYEKIDPFAGKRIPFVKNGYYTESDSFGSHPYHHTGMIYVQEPAAMSAAAAVRIETDWRVLDVCAAPGGKSTQLACGLESGVLVSNEIIPSRCRILAGNIERMGIKNAITTCADSARLASLFGSEFDLTVVDAPCSGEGMFRKNPQAAAEWSEAAVRSCAKRQLEILSNVRSCVKSGGYLLYSTCTFSLEENEMVVDSFIRSNPEFRLVPVTPEVQSATSDGIFFDGCGIDNIHYCRRFYPHISRGEGQFIALMKKDEAAFNLSVNRISALTPVPENEKKYIFGFLDNTLERYNRDAVMKYKDSFVYFDRDMVIPGGVAFSCGVTIGSLAKNYIKPHHQFFSAMGGSFKRKLSLDLRDAERYISGETLECGCENGWAAALIEDCALGGVKVTVGTAKNHYPKGLRRL